MGLSNISLGLYWMGDRISLSISVDSLSDDTLNWGPLALLLWRLYEFPFGIYVVNFHFFSILCILVGYIVCCRSAMQAMMEDGLNLSTRLSAYQRKVSYSLTSLSFMLALSRILGRIFIIIIIIIIIIIVILWQSLYRAIIHKWCS